MIPILYPATGADYTGMGLGLLSDAKDCRVEESRNGVFFLTINYPVSGIHFEKLENSCIIMADAGPTLKEQLFRIVTNTKPKNGICVFYAEHVSYETYGDQLRPSVTVTNSSAAGALNVWKNNIIGGTPFTVNSDITTPNSAKWSIDKQECARQALGGSVGSVLDVWGGEYEFNNYSIFLHKERGQDKGLVISYGKNITDITQEVDIKNTYTSVMPFKMLEDGEEILTLPYPHYIDSKYVSNYPRRKIFRLDLSGDDSITTVAQMEAATRAYIENNEVGVPKFSLKLSYLDLQKVQEYRDKIIAEQALLCDTLTVYFPPLEIYAKAKVTRTVWNVITEQFEELELGNARADLSCEIIRSEELVKKVPSLSDMQRAIQNATELIAGAKGGYFRTYPDPPAHPEGWVIMDTPNILTSQKLWRASQGGIGFSRNGFNGQYELAMTMDGAIVADRITTGTLNAALATIINLNASNITTGTMSADRIRGGLLESLNNVLRFNLNTGVLRVSLDRTLYMYLYQSGLVMSPTEDVADRIGGIFRAAGTNNIICEAQHHPLRFSGSNVGGLYTNDQGEPRVVVKDIYLQQNGQNKASYTLDAQGNARLFTKDIYLQQDGQNKASFTVNSAGQPGISMGDTGAWWGINANSSLMALVSDELQAKQNFFFQNKLVRTTNITDTSGHIRHVMYVD